MTRPVPMAALDPSPFGVVCPWRGLKEAGIKWVRCGAGATAFSNWPGIEKEPGKFDWKGCDAELRAFYDPQGLELLPILGYTPKWASSNPDAEKPQHWPPRDVRLYSRFVKAIVSRYRRRVKCWEVWNEPNIGFFNGSVKAYTDLLKAAYVAAKSADPGCLVVFGGTAGVDVEFLRRAYEFGAGGYFDVVAVHPYQWGPRFDARWFEGKLQRLRELMDGWGDSWKEVWLTEVGWSTGDRRITPQIQADLLVQCLTTALTLRHLGVAKVFWFCVKDWGGPGYGLFDTKGDPKPAYFAYKTLVRELSGAEYVGRLDVGREGVWAHVFVKGGRSILVLWREEPEGRAEVSVPCSSSRAVVVDIFGRARALRPEGGLLRLEASHSPVFVEAGGVGAFGRTVKPPRAKRPPPPEGRWLKGVWLGVSVPDTTMRPFLTIGEVCELTVEVHNDLPSRAEGFVRAEIPALKWRARRPFSLAPGGIARLKWRLRPPPGLKPGLYRLRVTGEADGRPLYPIERLPVRLTKGRAVEFLANSFTERLYVKPISCGCAESLRFGREWDYLFDVEGARGGALSLDVGANMARGWSVLISTDGGDFVEVLSGRSWPSWHRVSLDRFLPAKRLAVKIRGEDAQLRELVMEVW